MKETFLRVCHSASRYRVVRYATYLLAYLLYVPVRYLFEYIWGWFSASLRETRCITKDLIGEYKTFARILRMERENAKQERGK
jgi:hypothetical protein